MTTVKENRSGSYFALFKAFLEHSYCVLARMTVPKMAKKCTRLDKGFGESRSDFQDT
jgi:hypothetical protein